MQKKIQDNIIHIIKNYKFKQATTGGYNMVHVDSFLDELEDRISILYQQLQTLKQTNIDLKSQVDQTNSINKNLNNEIIELKKVIHSLEEAGYNSFLNTTTKKITS
ncbi:DivIVA domain-containing protein [[Mycoplasma] cavipharyngis]|uniref:DivIVA domain-containing protein n=1 Tax=[Mycoplasma] cavipharyngis TaxID=92757 RepID=UPI003704A893